MPKYAVEVVFHLEADSEDHARSLVDVPLSEATQSGYEIPGYEILDRAVTLNEDDEGSPLPTVSWDMYTDEGDAVVEEHVSKFLEDMKNGEFERRDLAAHYENLLAEIAAAGYGEVYDTEPRANISEAIDKLCHELLWEPLCDF